MPITIRLYQPSYKSAVVSLLRLNTPEFFTPDEEEELTHYLDNEVEDYFVVKHNNKIIGAGGINYFEDERTARISWDIIDPNFQSTGVGRQLTEYRIDHIKNHKDIDTVIVRTSQLAYKFYEKMGFKLTEITKDFWAVGYDLYLMEHII